jgi:hypothetical protein
MLDIFSLVHQLCLFNSSNHGNENDDAYVFTVSNGLENSDFIIEVGGVKIPVIVDWYKFFLFKVGV